MENNQGPSSWALTFVSLLACLFRWQFLCKGVGLSVLMFGIFCVTRVPMQCQRLINKCPRACGQEGQTHCTSPLTSASIYCYVTLFTPPAMSHQQYNTMKSQWVVMSASISNNGQIQGTKTWIVINRWMPKQWLDSTTAHGNEKHFKDEVNC